MKIINNQLLNLNSFQNNGLEFERSMVNLLKKMMQEGWLFAQWQLCVGNVEINPRVKVEFLSIVRNQRSYDIPE